TSGQQLVRHQKVFRDLVAGGGYVVDVGICQQLPIARIVAVALENIQPDVRVARQDFVETRRGPHIESHDSRHCAISQLSWDRVWSIQEVSSVPARMSASIFSSSAFLAWAASCTSATSCLGIESSPSSSPTIRSPGCITMPPMLIGTLISP